MKNKIKRMNVNMNCEIDFTINETIIEKVPYIKCLGFIIENRLNLKEHVDYICKGISKKKLDSKKNQKEHHSAI